MLRVPRATGIKNDDLRYNRNLAVAFLGPFK